MLFTKIDVRISGHWITANNNCFIRLSNVDSNQLRDIKQTSRSFSRKLLMLLCKPLIFVHKVLLC